MSLFTAFNEKTFLTLWDLTCWEREKITIWHETLKFRCRKARCLRTRSGSRLAFRAAAIWWRLPGERNYPLPPHCPFRLTCFKFHNRRYKTYRPRSVSLTTSRRSFWRFHSTSSNGSLYRTSFNTKKCLRISQCSKQGHRFLPHHRHNLFRYRFVSFFLFWFFFDKWPD